MALPVIHRKELILFTTIDVISEFGIQSVSTREVARRQGVSEGTIFKHFPKKNDLILAVYNYFSQYDEDIFLSTQLKKMKLREAILYIIDSYTTYYENYPAITALTQTYDVMRCEPDLSDKVKNIYASRAEGFKKIFDDAKRDGEIGNEIDIEALVDIIMGTINGLCLKWRMKEYGFPLKKESLNTINLILDAFSITEEEY